MAAGLPPSNPPTIHAVPFNSVDSFFLFLSLLYSPLTCKISLVSPLLSLYHSSSVIKKVANNASGIGRKMALQAIISKSGFCEAAEKGEAVPEDN